jgi:F1F0 ATPase subunit 2
MNTDWASLETPFLLAAMVAGVGLGLFYFGGLWWTTQRLPVSHSPGLLVLVSFAGRTAITLCAFYFVMGGQWQRLVACLAGFILARVVLTRRLGPKTVGEKP